MKEKSQPPLRLTPYYSNQLAGYLLATHLIALLTIIAVVRPWWFAIWLVVVTLFSLIHSYRRHLQYRGKNTVRSVEINGQNEWRIQQADGVEVTAQLQSNSYIHPRLSVLNFRNEQGRRQSLVLLPDGIDAATFRRLRVRLKMQQQAG
jgi:hypothetical protein